MSENAIARWLRLGGVDAAPQRMRNRALGHRPWRTAAAGIAAVALLSGCGGGSGTATSAPATTAVTTEAAVTSGGAATTRRGPGAGQSPAALRANLQTTLEPLVSNNTLTSAQESAVVDTLAQRPLRAPNPTASGSAAASITTSATTSGRGQGRPGAGGFATFQRQALDPLVQQGTITATQETAVLQALQQTAGRRPNGTPTP